VLTLKCVTSQSKKRTLSWKTIALIAADDNSVNKKNIVTEKIILYKSSVDKFTKRFWRFFLPYFILYGVALTPPLFFLDGFKPIIIFWSILMLTCILIMFFSSYKWALKKISLITATADNFEIEITVKDIADIYKIPINNLIADTKWVGGRQKVLKLTLFDKNKKIANFYSGGREKETQELEAIKFSIGRHLSAS